MKEMKENKEGSTYLIRDFENSVTEITFRSIFPNLIIISSQQLDEFSKIFEEGICSLVILDTKIEKVSAFILDQYENGKTDIIPYKIGYVDPRLISPNTLTQLVLFEYHNLKSESIRTQIKFLMNSTLSSIAQLFGHDDTMVKSIESNPELFYYFSYGIKNEDKDSFFKFCISFTQLTKEKDVSLVPELIKYSHNSHSNELLARVFVQSVSLFFDEQNFAKISESFLKFLNDFFNNFGVNLFAIPALAYSYNLIYCAFDRPGTFTTLQDIGKLLPEGSHFSHDLFIDTLSRIFANSSYRATATNEALDDSNTLCHNDLSYYRASELFSKIAESKKDLAFSKRYHLYLDYVDYLTYLLNGSNPNNASDRVKKYLELKTMN